MNRVVHKFYLPEGTWYDFKNGKKFPGNRSYVSFFKDEDYPVFAKSGAIIPMDKNVNNSLAYVPVSIFCAPSVYSGGYIQINSNTNQGELILSFSSNLPVGTDIMIGATYVS